MPAANSTTARFTDDELLNAFVTAGDREAAAAHLGIGESSYRRALKNRGLDKDPRLTAAQQKREQFQERQQTQARGDRPGIWIKDDGTATLVSEANPDTLGDAETLMRNRGLDPDDWVIQNMTVNEWEAMTAVKPKGHELEGENQIVVMHQLKLVLKRRNTYILLAPASHVPPLVRSGTQAKGEAEFTFIEYDAHVPFHDPRLHEAKLAMLAQVQPHRQNYGGDLLDFSTISRHGDHPATNGMTPQMCVNQGYRYLRDDCEASPYTERKKLKGNHDWRLENEQLQRSERVYDLCPAEEDVSALDLRRLLKFVPYGPLPIELVTHPKGWEHAEIEIVPGQKGLVMRHGWMTGTNTAERSMKRRGRSTIVGHTHQRELTYWWDPSSEVERVGAVSGCQCLVRDVRHPHYVVLERWTQGPIMVTTWQDGTFTIEHMLWDGRTLRWRSERWTA